MVAESKVLWNRTKQPIGSNLYKNITSKLPHHVWVSQASPRIYQSLQRSLRALQHEQWEHAPASLHTRHQLYKQSVQKLCCIDTQSAALSTNLWMDMRPGVNNTRARGNKTAMQAAQGSLYPSDHTRHRKRTRKARTIARTTQVRKPSLAASARGEVPARVSSTSVCTSITSAGLHHQVPWLHGMQHPLEQETACTASHKPCEQAGQ